MAGQAIGDAIVLDLAQAHDVGREVEDQLVTPRAHRAHRRTVHPSVAGVRREHLFPAARPARQRRDAKGAVMVAPILHLDKGAGMVGAGDGGGETQTVCPERSRGTPKKGNRKCAFITIVTPI